MRSFRNQYPTISMPVTLLFNLYVFIWWLEIGKRISFFATIRFEFIIGATLGAIGLSKYFSKNNKQNINADLVKLIFLYLIILLLSIPLAIDSDVAWNAYINKVLKYALMSFFISQFVVSNRTLQFFIFSSFLAFFKIGQEAFVGKITGSMVWENQGIPRLHGSPGTMFGHPNSLSGKIVSSLPFCWYLYPVLRKYWIKILVLIQVFFSLNIILFTGSRTGYLTFLIMILSFFVLSKKKIRGLLFVIILGVVSVSYIPNDYTNRFISSFSGHEKEGNSKDARIGLLKDSLSVFVNNPLGVGLFCFPELQRQAGRNAQETHNLYTQILAETGVQGGLCFLYFIWVLLKMIFRLRSGFSKNIFLLIFLFLRLVLGVLGHDLLEIYWWIAAGIAMAMNKIFVVSEKRVNEIVLRISG